MAGYVEHLRHVYGYTAIFAVIALDNVGVFVAGETMLIRSVCIGASTSSPTVSRPDDYRHPCVRNRPRVLPER
jgi:hypothetical protein